MAILTALTIAKGVAAVIPAIKHFFDGDSKDDSVIETVANIAETITGKTGDAAIDAINSDPNIALEFKKAVMADKHVEAKLENERLAIVNKTMQIEANSDKWWVSGWRPFIGFVSGISFAVCVVFVCILAWKAINNSDQNALQMIPTMIFNFTTLFGFPCTILGIASHHRGRMQRDKNNR